MSHEPLQDAVLAWYDEHGRDLPWRRTRDPYAILVSEVMAQQTQIARVLERYERWLARWPTAAALAAASPAEVLTEWVGLGYNRRALRLREAAAIVARDGWPRDAAGLRALPGVGPYTAAAVASFAFGERDRGGRHERAPRRVAPARRAAGAAARAPPRRLQPGRDGARRRPLHRPRAALRRLPGGAVVPVARARRDRRRARPAARASASRTPIAGCAAASSRRWRPATRCRSAIAPERLERALAALEREGLVERDGAGVGLPR